MERLTGAGNGRLMTGTFTFHLRWMMTTQTKLADKVNSCLRKSRLTLKMVSTRAVPNNHAIPLIYPPFLFVFFLRVIFLLPIGLLSHSIAGLETYYRMYQHIRVPVKFVVPAEKGWPSQVWGHKLGARVSQMRQSGSSCCRS